jgi:hypothetical protein
MATAIIAIKIKTKIIRTKQPISFSPVPLHIIIIFFALQKWYGVWLFKEVR